MNPLPRNPARQLTTKRNCPMTMDKSLRTRKGGTAVRGVLTRVERIVKLKEQDRWVEGRSPIGLPKVRVPKLTMKKKKKAAEEPEGDAKKKK
jgi:small basic protein (TIGR04137 family)